MALVATPGASNANSYLTVPEAEAYLDVRPHSTAWDDIDDDEAALIAASRQLDWYMQWKGAKTSSSQSLEWPRASVYDRNGFLLDDEAIPERLKHAVVELALLNIAADRTADQDLDGFSSIRVGPLALKSDAVEPRSSKKKVIPMHIRKMLSDLVTNPPGVGRLIRA